MSKRPRTFRKLEQLQASTKRGSLSGGKVGTPSTRISSLSVVPLHPVDAETASRPELSGPFRSWQTGTQGEDLDIRNGDLLVIGANEYPILIVEKWPWSGDLSHYRLVVKDG